MVLGEAGLKLGRGKHLFLKMFLRCRQTLQKQPGLTVSGSISQWETRNKGDRGCHSKRLGVSETAPDSEVSFFSLLQMSVRWAIGSSLAGTPGHTKVVVKIKEQT